MQVAGCGFGVTAVTTVAEIPVHVAQKRVKASSPCSDDAPQSRSTAPGNVLGHSLSVWQPHEDTGDILRKLIVSCTRSFLDSVFGKDRLTGGPGRDFCFQPVFRVQTPLVGRGIPPKPPSVTSAERLWDNPTRAMWKLSLFLPLWSSVHACVSLGPKTNLCSRRKLRCCFPS